MPAQACLMLCDLEYDYFLVSQVMWACSSLARWLRAKNAAWGWGSLDTHIHGLVVALGSLDFSLEALNH